MSKPSTDKNEIDTRFLSPKVLHPTMPPLPERGDIVVVAAPAVEETPTEPDTAPESAPVEIELDELSVPEAAPDKSELREAVTKTVNEFFDSAIPAPPEPIAFDIAELRNKALANMAARHNRAFPQLVSAIDGLIVGASESGGRAAVLRADIDSKLCERLKKHYEEQGEKNDRFKVTYHPVDVWPDSDGYFKVMW